MQQTIRAIETTYKGYRFRSRLEARWAVFFDALGDEWEYEPEGYVLSDGTPYLPDFRLTKPGRRGRNESESVWVEIKPKEFTTAEFYKAMLLAQGTGVSVVMAGGMPEHRSYPMISTGRYGNETACEVVDVLIDCTKRRIWWAYGDDAVTELNYEEYREAVNAARSARFEFGQSGAA